MSTKRAAWISGFLAVTALAIAGELYAAFDSSPDTTPWTDLLVRYVPWPVTALATAVLVIWLPIHFFVYYRRGRQPASPARRSDIMTQPVPPVPPGRYVAGIDAPPPAPDPASTSEEPLLKVGSIVAAVTALLDVALLFGLPLSSAQQAGILTVVNVLAPLVVAAIARHKVWSPASVLRLLAAQRR